MEEKHNQGRNMQTATEGGGKVGREIMGRTGREVGTDGSGGGNKEMGERRKVKGRKGRREGRAERVAW